MPYGGMKTRVYQGNGKRQTPSWVSHSLDCLIYSHSLFILISLIQGHTVTTLRAKSVAIRGQFLQKQIGLYLHAPESSQIVLLLPLHESELEYFPHTQIQTF